MKLNLDKFLSIFYSVMNENNIECVDIIDMIEIVKIIFSSDEFELLSKRLNINEFKEEDIEKNKNTISFDDEGLVSFKIPEEKRKKIIKENVVDAGYIQLAINKRSLVKYFESKFRGLVDFKYDSPDGPYTIRCVSTPDQVLESQIFTDGLILNNNEIQSESFDETKRSLIITEASFSFLVSFIDKSIEKIELRNKGYYDYRFLINELNMILRDNHMSYDEEFNDSPKVYKYKAH